MTANQHTTPREAAGYITRPIPENIPDVLKERPQWVNWSYEVRGNDWTKIPYTNKGSKASTTDLMTWGSFEEALELALGNFFDGIGFCFCSADPFVGIDFDKCRNPETGEVDPRVLEYVGGFEECHAEVSVSGTGIHLITRGKIKGGARSGGYELYDQDRFFVVTGVLL